MFPSLATEISEEDDPIVLVAMGAKASASVNSPRNAIKRQNLASPKNNVPETPEEAHSAPISDTAPYDPSEEAGYNDTVFDEQLRAGAEKPAPALPKISLEDALKIVPAGLRVFLQDKMKSDFSRVRKIEPEKIFSLNSDAGIAQSDVADDENYGEDSEYDGNN